LGKEIFQTYLKNGDGPFLSTGDLGIFYGGELFITGRLKDIIIIRGRNHYPQDIEKTVEQCHLALQPLSGACISVDGESVVVVHEVGRRFVRKLNVEEVTRSIIRSVNDCHGLQVSDVFLLKPGHIPRTSSGKIRRRICHDLILKGEICPISVAV
jgi:acyl-CoA synthetase (AMP-forming)/AMP-acid ligase II